MARPPRIEFPDAIYHVTLRGVGREDIVADRRDRDRWLGLLERSVRRRRWRLFAFALMNNHFHLFVQTPDANLAAGMHGLNGSYASYFNRRYERSGHLYEGRFRAILVEEEGHWLEVSRYIHLNPVRARIVARPEAWPWSSYAGYHRPARRLGWLDYGRVLDEFGGDTPDGRKLYREFVEEGLGRKLDSPLSAALHGIVLGSDRFLARVRGVLGRQGDDAEAPLLPYSGSRPGLEAVIAVVATHYSVDPSTWTPGRRHDVVPRSVAAFLGRHVAGAAARDVAAALGYRSTSSVSVACRRVEEAGPQSPLARDVRRLMQHLASLHQPGDG